MDIVLEKNVLLSIVVPVYNVEAYIEECLNSVVTQVEDLCEIILVDDGSQDASGRICDRYQSQYWFVKVIHQENGGLSSARNSGIEIARGKYVCFLDSDDKISPKAMPQILDWIKRSDADICFMQAIKFYPNGKTEDLGDSITAEDIEGKDKEEIIKRITCKSKFPGSSCTKLYKMDFLLKNKIYFPKERTLSEDLGFVLDTILMAKSYDCLDFDYYEYRQNRRGSITNCVSERTLDGLIIFIDEAVKKLTVCKEPVDKISKYLMGYVAYEYSVLMFDYTKYKGASTKYKIYLKQNRWILKYSRTKKTKIINVFSRLFGIQLTAKLISLAKKI